MANNLEIVEFSNRVTISKAYLKNLELYVTKNFSKQLKDEILGKNKER